MKFLRSRGHIFGGSLLIAGTAIGLGMFGLPIATAPGGYLPAIMIYLLCWGFMLCTGLLMVEVCSWMPKESNLITMAERLLGPTGKNVCWVVYLFLFVTVMIAHVSAGGEIFSEIFGPTLSKTAMMLFYVLLFSPVVYFGTRTVEWLNVFFVAGTLISYLLFVSVASEHVNLEFLQYSNWSKAWFALPILFTAFTYQVIIPTLMNYLDRDVKRVKLCILFGTSIPLVIYLVWETLILGIIPVEGPNGLLEAARLEQNAITPLKAFVTSSAVVGFGRSFAFFTFTASYIALSLAFLDFLADGLKIENKGIKKLILCLAVFVPPTSIAITYPQIFITALTYAGGYSCAILFGLFPPLMAWVGRYVLCYPPTSKQLPGGKIFLSLLILFVVFELGLTLSEQFILK